MPSKKNNTIEIPKRLAPTKETLNLLFALSGNQCAFPGCQSKLFNQKNKLIAHVCHIEAALPGGERFNINSNNQARRHFDNLLAMCLEHHVETDDTYLFKTEDLQKMKAEHEQRFKGVFSPNDDQIDDAYDIEVKNSLIRIEDSTKRIEKSVGDSTVAVFEMHGMLKQLLEKETVGTETQIGYDSKLDEIFVYRSKGRPQTAIEHFNSLRKSDWNKMDDREKYRLLALTGICQIDLLDTQGASKSFIEGLSFQQDNIKAINFGILGHAIAGDHLLAMELVEKGLAIDPLHSGILSSKIRLISPKNLDQLIKSLPDEVLKNVEIAFEIARKFRSTKDYKSAYKWLETAKNNNSGFKHEILSLQATFILESTYDNHKINSRQTSFQMLNDAKRIIDLYSEAWEEIEGTELATSRVWYLQNRAIAKKITGDKEGYYEDIFHAANITDSYEVKKQLLLVSIEMGKFKKADEMILKLKQLASKEEQLALTYFEASRWLMEEQVSIAESLLKGLLNKPLPTKLYSDVLLDLYGIYVHQKKLDLAENCVSELEKNSPHEISTMTIRARIDALFGRKNLKTALLEVKEKITSDMPSHEIEILAGDLAKCRCFRDAAELYELIVDESTFSPMMETLLHYYNLIGDNSKILTIAENLLEKYGPIRICSEMVSYVYERIRDEEKAIKTCEDYLAIYPDDQQMRLRFACIYDRIRDFEKLRMELGKFEHLDKNLTMPHQFTIARLMLKVGMVDRARLFAYETRRQFYDLGDAHNYFFAFHLDEEKINSTNQTSPITEIAKDCVVSLKTGAHVVDLILEDHPNLVESRGERSIHSFEGKALMGKQVGDIVFTHPSYQDLESQVVSISSKFDYAIRKSLKLLETVFANQSSMRSFQFPDSGDPEEMRNALFDILEKHGGNDSSLNEHYQSGIFPIGAVALSKGKNPIEIWMDYAGNPQMGVHSMISGENFENAIQLFESGAPLVFDIIALLTLFQLDLQEEIKNLGNRKIVVKSTLDHIQLHIEELTQVKGTQIINLSRIDGQVFRELKTREDIDEHIAFFEQMLQWIRANVEVVPCEAALSINWNEKQTYDETLSESTVDAMLTANHVHGLLFAEESTVRNVAKSEMNVEGLCTFQFIYVLLRMKTISFQEYEKGIFGLLQLNYKLFPGTINVLNECAIYTRNAISAPLINALLGLTSGNLPKQLALQTAAGFITTVYLKQQPHLIERMNPRENVITALIDSLCLRYDALSIKTELIILLKNLIVDPRKSSIVIEIVENYFDRNTN